jgi:hypothetical protein
METLPGSERARKGRYLGTRLAWAARRSAGSRGSQGAKRSPVRRMGQQSCLGLEALPKINLPPASRRRGRCLMRSGEAETARSARVCSRARMARVFASAAIASISCADIMPCGNALTERRSPTCSLASMGEANGVTTVATPFQ